MARVVKEQEYTARRGEILDVAERLVETIVASHAGSAAEMVAAINAALLRFTERPPFDDLTLVVIKRA